MRYLSLILIILFSSCIKITTDDLVISQMDAAVDKKLTGHTSTNFWQAMQNLDLTYPDQIDLDEEQKQFSTALAFMLDGKYGDAQTIFEALIDSSRDSLMIDHSATLLSGIYMKTFDWDALIKLDNILPKGLDDMNTISLIKAWDSRDPENIQYPDSPLVLPMKPSISGVPMIKVLVNGIEQTFWVDTGAEFTVLSSDIAKKCGVMSITESATKVGTSTDAKIDLWPGVIDELKIEDLVFENHPVFIINKDNLEFHLFKIFRLLKIDGIIGWNAIQNLTMRIDNPNETLTISQPVLEKKPSRNFHYLTQPFVTVYDTTGNPMAFFLDTGANTTGIYPPAYAYFDTSNAEITGGKIGGAGGMQSVKFHTLKDQSFILGDTRIDFPKLSGKPSLGDDDEGFVQYYGIIGSNLARDGVLVLDFKNGWCEVIPGQKD